MIEIFRTNVEDEANAGMLVSYIEKHFKNYEASFDLEDCDRILRVINNEGEVFSYQLIKLLFKLGCKAEILEDENPSAVQIMMHNTKYYSVLE